MEWEDLDETLGFSCSCGRPEGLTPGLGFLSQQQLTGRSNCSPGGVAFFIPPLTVPCLACEFNSVPCEHFKLLHL